MPVSSKSFYQPELAGDFNSVNNRMIRAGVIKRLAKRVLRGEQFNIQTELVILLEQEGYHWESYDSTRAFLNKVVRELGYLAPYSERPQTNVVEAEEAPLLTFRGQEYAVHFDYTYRGANGTTFYGIIKTGAKPSNSYGAIMEQALLYLYAQSQGGAAEMLFLAANPVPDTLVLTNSALRGAFISEDGARPDCNPQMCGTCNLNRLCHFSEPPLALDVLRQVSAAGNVDLSPEQLKIVQFSDGIARVNAGPGAGKTLVVAFRVRELLAHGTAPEDILLLTFTRAGAEEMHARIVSYCDDMGISAAEVRCNTFNGFCMSVITEHYDDLGYASAPAILTDAEKYEICNKILAEFPQIPGWNYGSTMDSMSRFSKNIAIISLVHCFDAIKAGKSLPPQDAPDSSEPAIRAMFDKYQQVLFSRCRMEFADQMNAVVRLAEIVPDIWQQVGGKHIIVDEFQDTDLTQIQFLQRLIAADGFRSFMAVGDDSQSIFGFRETSPEYMINFRSYFGDFTDLNLLTCRRCPQSVVALANRINLLRTSRAADAPLVSPKPDVVPPDVQGFYTADDEVSFICDSVEADIAGGVSPSQIAVLARNKNDIAPIATELSRRGVPAIVCNPVPFKSDDRVFAICELWNSWIGKGSLGKILYLNAMSHGALSNAPKDQLDAAVQSLVFPEHRSVEDFVALAAALDTIDGDGKFDACYREFFSRFEHLHSRDDLAEFFDTFDTYGDKDMFRRSGVYEGVCLTTVHSAKGLEWDVTYLTLTHFDREEYHQSPQKFRDSGELDENVRLWFVGATRAKVKLVMTGLFEVASSSKSRLFSSTRTTVFNSYLKSAYELLAKPFHYSVRDSLKAQVAASRHKVSRITPSVPTILEFSAAHPELQPDVLTSMYLEALTASAPAPDTNNINAGGRSL